MRDSAMHPVKLNFLYLPLLLYSANLIVTMIRKVFINNIQRIALNSPLYPRLASNPRPSVSASRFAGIHHHVQLHYLCFKSIVKYSCNCFHFLSRKANNQEHLTMGNLASSWKVRIWSQPWAIRSIWAWDYKKRRG